MNEPQENWLPMSLAPRDGEIIEIRCDFGRASWYGIFRWGQEITSAPQEVTLRPGESAVSAIDLNGSPAVGLRGDLGKPAWVNAEIGQYTYLDSDENLTWRSWVGDPAYYVDPTDGKQYGMEYWRKNTPPTTNPLWRILKLLKWPI